MRKIYGVVIIVCALLVFAVGGAYVVGEYERPPLISEAQLAEMDAQSAELTRSQAEQTTSTMRTTAWISFAGASIAALLMVFTGVRLILAAPD